MAWYVWSWALSFSSKGSLAKTYAKKLVALLAKKGSIHSRGGMTIPYTHPKKITPPSYSSA